MLDLDVGEVAPGLLLGMEKMNVGSGAACPGLERAKLGAEFDHASSPTTGFYLSLGVCGHISSTSPSCGHLLGEDPLARVLQASLLHARPLGRSDWGKWVQKDGGAPVPGECLAGVGCFCWQTGGQPSVLCISAGAQKRHHSPTWKVVLCCKSCREREEGAVGQFLLFCPLY